MMMLADETTHLFPSTPPPSPLQTTELRKNVAAERQSTMDFDSVLVELGEFGRYQALTYLLICLPVFFSAANSLTYVFTAGVPPYRCLVPGCDNESTPQFSEGWLQNAIPASDEDTRETGYIPSHCTVFARNATNAAAAFSSETMTCEPEDFARSKTESCDQWVFHPHEHTIVNEWNITCLENQWKLSLVGTMHFAGILVGSLVFGYLADRYGRKVVFVMSLVSMSLTGVMQAVSPDYTFFLVFVFFNAIATAGVYPLAFILGVELVGPGKREMSSIVLNYFYAVGEASVGLVAWLSGNWKVLQLFVSAPPAIFIVYYWAIPESVRWLLTQSQHREARRIVSKAAKANGVVLSDHLLSALDEGGLTSSKTEPSSKGFFETVGELCRSRKLCLRSLNLFFNWAANAFVYYGLSVNSTSLGGNKYVNFALVCLVEIPGYTLAWFALKRGRRLALCGSLILCAVTCLGAAFVPSDNSWAILVLFLVGKIGVTASFATIYVYTAELYPTPMRSASVGCCSMMARFGAMVAPFAPLLGVYSAPLPLLMFGAISLAAGLLGLMLPETMGIRLPDTVKEAEQLL